jgi:hypothetical protein
MRRTKKMRGMRVIFLSNNQKIVSSTRTSYQFRKEEKEGKKMRAAIPLIYHYLHEK